jgi:hypothetical protein
MVFPESSATVSIEAGSITEDSVNSVAILNYSTTPNHLYPFIFKGSTPPAFPDMDISDCTVGKLYVYNKNTDMLMQLTSENVIAFTATQDGIYYVSAERQIAYAAFDGANIVVIGTVHGNIASLDYFDGILAYVEDGSKIVFVDVYTGAYEIQFTANAIKSIYQFDHDKLIWRDSDGTPNYLNLATAENIVMGSEMEVNCLIAPYIKQQTEDTSMYAIDDITSSSGNDVTFPLENDFPANELTYAYNYPAASSYFNTIDTTQAKCNHSSYCNSIRYCGHTQCFGFAIYAHDKYLHLYSESKLGLQTGVTNPEGWAEGDFVQCATVSKNSAGEYVVVITDGHILRDQFDDTKAFFQRLKPGAYVRYGKDDDEDPENGSHSIVVASIEDEGIWAYECNVDDKCGVYYVHYRYDYLDDGRFDYIHNYVNHTFSAQEYESTSTHTVGCVNCDGYLRQPHEDVSVGYQDGVYHTIFYNCCGGAVPERHSDTTLSYIRSQKGHIPSYDCCEADSTLLQAHKYSNGRCSVCGYVQPSIIKIRKIVLPLDVE